MSKTWNKPIHECRQIFESKWMCLQAQRMEVEQFYAHLVAGECFWYWPMFGCIGKLW